MTTFGTQAEKLALSVAEREEDLRRMQDFREKGGIFRLSLDCDHPDPAIRAAVERSFERQSLKHQVLEQVILTVTAELEVARRRLVAHVNSSSMVRP